MKIFATIFAFLFISIPQNINPQGKILLVLGSDTAIWDGMSVDRFHCYYNFELFTSPASNTNTVMSNSFRNQIMDSYGNPLKMTWWMIGGNMYRYALNNNVPVPNTMAMYLMKKYFGDKINEFGDELSLHYHTFWWTDYDKDGKYWWNQALSFNETREDFDLILAQFLLEENIFPVSFRSGWHYMDNDWQNYLNELLPYSLHNDWPAKRYNLTEPIDNIYDWSQAPSDFIPFHPSEDNYQLPGNGKGWNVRSKYMGSVTTQLVTEIFEKAEDGIDQVVCLWSHLPDANFINEIVHVNSVFHQVKQSYPGIDFQYCTAVEAYRIWRQSSDTTKPVLNLTEEISGNEVKFIVSTNEEIFQKKPFLAVKDIYENYFIADFEELSENTWKTIDSYKLDKIVKTGAAITDTIGNLSTAFLTYLPDEQFIDDDNPLYQEIYGNWENSSLASWGLNSRKVNLNQGDSAKVKWNFNISKTGLYNLFIQFPETENLPDSIFILVSGGGLKSDTTLINGNIEANKWIYINTAEFSTGENNFVEMFAVNNSNDVKTLSADVVKISAYVRDIQLLPDRLFINFNEVSVEDTISFNLNLSNIGLNDLTVNDVTSVKGYVDINISLPLIIEGMSVFSVPLIFIANEIGSIQDTIIIQSNDPHKPLYKIPLIANVENYFSIVDNEDIGFYSEIGTWHTSVAQAYGSSSRYAYLTPGGGAQASFYTSLKKSGYYDVNFIVPQTVNSADKALYELIVDGVIRDSVYVNQNEGSGEWRTIGRYFIPANVPVILKVIDSGESTSGPVIRADAVKIQLYRETTSVNNNEQLPDEFVLYQNYPNPFNPTTKIKYSIPSAQRVRLVVYDILGNEIAVLINEEQHSGAYEITFDGSSLSSGIYFYKLTAGSFSDTKKLILIK